MSGLAAIFNGLAEELRAGPGPVKWCKRCGRKHPKRRPCELTTVAVEAKSGRVVQRQVHTPKGKR